MIYDIFHWTEYRYSQFIPLSMHALHLLPRDLPGQRVISAELELTPKASELREHVDYFGNRVTSFMIAEPNTGMHIKCRSRVECEERLTAVPESSPAWELVRELGHRGEGGAELQNFFYPSPYIPYLERLRDWAAETFTPERPFLAGVQELNARIFEHFDFDKAATNVSTPLIEVFEQQRGVCQDFAHLEIACLRALGLPARYISGYMRTEPAPGQPRIFGADASHAWVSVFCPENGWIEFDPTNNRLAADGYVTLAIGRDYGDISLIRGALSGGGEHSLYLSVNVELVT